MGFNLVKIILSLIPVSCFAASFFLFISSGSPVPKRIANLFAWYDASVSSSLTLSGSDVSQWGDLTSNSYHVSAASNFPTFSATGLNGLPTINFSGTNQQLNRLGTGGDKTAFTVWAIANFNSSNASDDTMIWAPSTAFASGGATGDVLLERSTAANKTGIFVTNRPLPVEASITNNVAQRIAYVSDGSGNLSIYVNGLLAGTGTDVNTKLGTNLQFGSLRGFSSCCDWQGSISEIAMYSRALTEPELLQLDTYGYLKWFPGYWTANTTSTKFTGSQKIHGALNDFDYEASGSTFTWNVWIRPEDNSSGDYMSIFSKEDDPPANQRGYAWVFGTDGRMLFTFINKFPGPGENLFTINCNDQLIRNGSKWSMVTLTWDGTSSVDANNTHIYINGTECSGYTIPSNNLSGTTQNPNRHLKFGYDHASTPYYFDGLMDEMSNWSVALTQPQIAALYNAGRPADLTGSTNLIHWWRMGDLSDSPTTIYDRVGSKHLSPQDFSGSNFSNSVPNGQFP